MIENVCESKQINKFGQKNIGILKRYSQLIISLIKFKNMLSYQKTTKKLVCHQGSTYHI